MTIKVLVELRPAFDGHAGIPQEVRLLFSGLARVPGVEVVGLLQSSNLVVEAGLPLVEGRAIVMGEPSKAIDRMSQVVVSLQQGPLSHRFEHLRKILLKLFGPLGAATGSVLGARVPLTAFLPEHFKDFVWRALFANTLEAREFELLTSREFRVMRWPWSLCNAVGVATANLGHALYPRLDTTGLDLMIAETPYPGRVSGRTRMIVRYHDAMPMLMPHTVKNRGYHRATHFNCLQRNVRDGAWFACVSDASRADLISLVPQAEARSVTIPNMISHHYFPETDSSDRVHEIIWSRKNREAPHHGGAALSPDDRVAGEWPYLLMVSTIEPRKNHLALLDAWELLRAGLYPHLNLILVGSLGWDHDEILRRFSPWLQRGGLHVLENVPAADLRLLYRHAAATVCPSLGEGFDFAGVEAMRSGGVVAASDIRVHRDVYGAAAEYFSAYAPQDMAAAISRVIDPAAGNKRAELRSEGARVAAQYLPDRVLPQWHDFLRRVVG